VDVATILSVRLSVRHTDALFRCVLFWSCWLLMLWKVKPCCETYIILIQNELASTFTLIVGLLLLVRQYITNRWGRVRDTVTDDNSVMGGRLHQVAVPRRLSRQLTALMRRCVSPTPLSWGHLGCVDVLDHPRSQSPSQLAVMCRARVRWCRCSTTAICCDIDASTNDRYFPALSVSRGCSASRRSVLHNSWVDWFWVNSVHVSLP